MALQTTLVFRLPSRCRVRWVINKTWGFVGKSSQVCSKSERLRCCSAWDGQQFVFDSHVSHLSLVIVHESPRPVNIGQPRSDCRVLRTDRCAFSSVLFWCAYGPTLPTPLTLHGNHLCDVMFNRSPWHLKQALDASALMHFLHAQYLFFSTNGMKDEGLCNNVKL